MLKLMFKERGFISIFLCLILLPMVTYSALIVDASRLQISRTHITTAGDMALNAAMSEYDQVLQDMYGLFANSTDPEKMKVALEMYFQENLTGILKPSTDSEKDFIQTMVSHLGSYFFSGTTEVSEDDIVSFLNMELEELQYAPIPESRISNPMILKGQIIDYMKFKGPISVGTNLLTKIHFLKDTTNQAKATEKKIEYERKVGKLEEPSLNAYDAIQEYNEALKDYDKPEFYNSQSVGWHYMACAEYLDRMRSALLAAQYIKQQLGDDVPLNENGVITDESKMLIGSSDIPAAAGYTEISEPTDSKFSSKFNYFKGLNDQFKNIFASDLYGAGAGSSKYEQRYGNVDIDASNHVTQAADAGTGDKKYASNKNITEWIRVYSEMLDMIDCNKIGDMTEYNDFDPCDIESDKGETNAHDYYQQIRNLNAVYDSNSLDMAHIEKIEKLLAIQKDFIPNKSTLNERAQYANLYQKLWDKYNPLYSNASFYADLDKVSRDQKLTYDEVASRSSYLPGDLNEIINGTGWSDTDKNSYRDTIESEFRTEYGASMSDEDWNTWKNTRFDDSDPSSKTYEQGFWQWGWREWTDGASSRQWRDKYSAIWDNIWNAWKGNHKTDSHFDLSRDDCSQDDAKKMLQASGKIINMSGLFDKGTAYQNTTDKPNAIDFGGATEKYYRQYFYLGMRMSGYSDYVNIEKGIYNTMRDDKWALDVQGGKTYFERYFDAAVKAAAKAKAAKDLMHEITTCVGEIDAARGMWETANADVRDDSTRSEFQTQAEDSKQQINWEDADNLYKILNTAYQRLNGPSNTHDEVVGVTRWNDPNHHNLTKRLATVKYGDVYFTKITATESDGTAKTGENALKIEDCVKFDKMAAGADAVSGWTADNITGTNGKLREVYKTGVVRNGNNYSPFNPGEMFATEGTIAYPDRNRLDTDKTTTFTVAIEATRYETIDGKKMYSQWANATPVEDPKEENPDEKFFYVLKSTYDAKHDSTRTTDSSKAELASAFSNAEGGADAVTEASTASSTAAASTLSTEAPPSKEEGNSIISSCQDEILNFNVALNTEPFQDVEGAKGKDPSISDANDSAAAAGAEALSQAAKLLEVLEGLPEHIGECVYLEEYFTEMFTCRYDVSDEGKGKVHLINGFKDAGEQGKDRLLNSSLPWYGSEVEYIIWGGTPESAVKQNQAMIFLIRFAINAIYAFKASDINMFASEVASFTVGWCPVLIPIVRVAIILGIAMAESALDLIQLNAGKDVVLFKNSNTFQCAPSRMLATVVKEAIDQGIEKLTDIATSKAEEGIDKLKAGVDGKIDDLSGKIDDVVNGFIEDTMNTIEQDIQDQVVTPIVDTAMSLTSQITDNVTSNMQLIEDAFEGPRDASGNPRLGTDGQPIKGLWDSLMDSIKPDGSDADKDNIVKQAIYQALTQKIGGTPLSDILKSRVKENLKAQFNVKAENLQSAFSVEAMTNAVMDPISEYKDDIEAKVKEVIKPVLDELKVGAEKLKGATDKGAEQLKNEAKKLITDMSEKLGDQGKKVSDQVADKCARFGHKTTNQSGGKSVTMNYKEYCKVFMFIKLMGGGEEHSLLRSAAIMNANVQRAVDNAVPDYKMVNAYTIININANVKMNTMFPWTVSLSSSDGDTNADGAQLDLSHLGHNYVNIAYSALNGY